ncbi:MAG: hypothetical protein ACLS6C_09600 [Clostridia bacterium]
MPSSSWTSDFCPPASAGEPPRQRRALNDGGGATERAQPFRAKKKMRSLGTVQVPTKAFLAVLKLDE